MVKWTYLEAVPDDTDAIKELLKNYSGIPEAEINSHLLDIREKAWAISRHPFIGRWKFLRLSHLDDPIYQQVCFRMKLPKSTDVYLDVGCGLGQSIRQMRFLGVDDNRLCALDIQPQFIELGYEMFRDKDTLNATFAVGDLIDPDNHGFDNLLGKATIIHADSFFHLFGWNQQLYAATRLVRFLQPGIRNALIYGRQVGSTLTEIQSTTEGNGPYIHNQKSLQQLWDEVAKFTGINWYVQVDQDSVEEPNPFATSKNTIPTTFIIYQI